MEVNPRHVSDSAEQRDAEAAVIKLLELEVGCSLGEESVPLGGGALMKIDAVNREHHILCEVYSRIGKLKGSQPDKLASDMLKLLLAESALGGAWRKIVCLADTEAAKCVQGRSWLAVAARQMGFEVKIVSLPPGIREQLLAAQRRQVMVNPGVKES